MSSAKTLQLMDGFVTLGQENEGLRHQLVESERQVQELRRAVLGMSEELAEAASVRARYKALVDDAEGRRQHQHHMDRSHGTVADRIAELGTALERCQAENMELSRRLQEADAVMQRDHAVRSTAAAMTKALAEARSEAEDTRRSLAEEQHRRLAAEAQGLALAATANSKVAAATEELRMAHARREGLDDLVRELRHTIDGLDADRIARHQVAAMAEGDRQGAVMRAEQAVRALQVQHSESAATWASERQHLEAAVRNDAERLTRAEALVASALDDIATLREGHQRSLVAVREGHDTELAEHKALTATTAAELSKARAIVQTAEATWRNDLMQMARQLEEHAHLRAEWVRDRDVLAQRLSEALGRVDELDAVCGVQGQQLRSVAMAMAEAESLHTEVDQLRGLGADLQGQRDYAMRHAADLATAARKAEDVFNEAMTAVQRSAAEREHALRARVGKLEKRLVDAKAKKLMERMATGGPTGADILRSLEESHRQAADMLQQVSLIA